MSHRIAEIAVIAAHNLVAFTTGITEHDLVATHG